jgi:hypothetical protein
LTTEPPAGFAILVTTFRLAFHRRIYCRFESQTDKATQCWRASAPIDDSIREPLPVSTATGVPTGGISTTDPEAVKR